MKITVPYGDGREEITIPDSNVLDIVGLNQVKIDDEEATLRLAIDVPINSDPFRDFVANEDHVLFIVNDGTRPTPTARILKTLEYQINQINNPEFIVATGTHREPTAKEYNRIFGGPFYMAYAGSIRWHDSKENEMVDLGITSRGTPVRVNYRVFEAEKIVAISSVEPHYFSGYTGGRKSIFPGVASYDWAEQNHKLAMEEGVAPMALEGNPVHEDMVESMELLAGKKVFGIQVVLSHDHRIYAATAGDLSGSFKAAVEKANDVFAAETKGPADIVISVAPFPMDLNFLQVQKALNNAKGILKEDGIFILVGRCADGIGGGNFFQLMSEMQTPEATMKAAHSNYRLGYHIAYNMAEMSMKHKLYIVSDLDDDDARTLFMEPFRSLRSAVDRALKEKGERALVTVLPAGSLTVPVITG